MPKLTAHELKRLIKGCTTLEQAADRVPGHHGIEYVGVGDRELAYLNMGDTYDQTVTRCGEGRLVVQSWGDWYECAEAAHENESDSVRCGYCGHFTPHTEGCEWRQVVCEQCGRRVDGSKVLVK
jgi:hypothetical protein